MDVDDLSRRMGEALGLALVFAASRDLLDPTRLSPGERARLDAFPLARRREDWLRGRAALKSVLRALELPEDTARIAFPHPRVSLTHSCGLAVAVGLPEAAGEGSLFPPFPGTPAGIGLDYEARRVLRPETLRFFLSESERERLGGHPDADDLLRLWTVKEALFKANPGNREEDGRYLAKYLLEGPPAGAVGAARAPGGRTMRYASAAAWDGMLSVAVSGGPAA